MLRRFLSVVAALGFLASVAVLVRQNYTLKRDVAFLLRSQVRPGARSRIEVGESLQQLSLVNYQNIAARPERLAGGRRRTIVHFLTFKCDACMAELRDWSDYIALHGSDDVVFVVVSGEETVVTIPNLSLPADHIFTLKVSTLRGQSLPRLPYTVLIDYRGIIIDVVAKVSDL